MSESEKVHKLGLKREPGYIYFVDGDGDISRSKNLGRKPKTATVVLGDDPPPPPPEPPPPPPGE